MHCWGAYQSVPNVSADVCVQRCTADAKCKAIVYHVPGQSQYALRCYLKSIAKLCASPGYDSLQQSSDYYIKI